MRLKDQSLNKVGQRFHHFELIKAVDIPELQCTLREFIHLPTGAQVIHIGNDDPENLFCLSFQTLPNSSNGVAHILEHTVLCGSKKYPIKDPFFSMTRRSLNTYMNALTGPDFTCYPAASQVTKDFYNLLEVYLDAVFHPKLDYMSFLQEGHRLEFSVPSDPNTPLEHKGIVYNEMLGGLASGRARLSEELLAALFPDISYGINSGGDPKEIVSLTYEELLEFHKKYYHPGHCVFYFYGDIPIENHLEFIEEHALRGETKPDPIEPLPIQPRFSHPRRLEKTYPIGNEEDSTNKTLIGLGWLTTHITQQEELLALGILEIILLDTDGSIVKKALLGSGYCKAVSAHLDGELQEAPWLIVLSGCEAKDADKLEKLLFETLREVVKEGIPKEKVEDAIHQVEFHSSEITGEHEPFGLSLFLRAGLLKHHGVEPEHGLSLHALFDKIRQNNSDNPSYFPQLIQKYLLDNPHFVRIVMTPSSLLAEEEDQERKAGLEKIKNSLTLKEQENLVNQASLLMQTQAEQQEADLDILPKFDLKDVPKSVRVFDLHHESIGILDVYHHSCFTNDIIYLNLVYDLSSISEEELPYVRLLTLLATQVGAGGRNYVENLDYIQAHTGGVRLMLNYNIHADDPSQFSPSIVLSGKALRRKGEHLSQLMYDIVTSADFNDRVRLKELIQKHYVAMQEGLTSNAIRYAVNLSASGLDLPGKLSNAWYGIDYFTALRHIAENIDTEMDKIVEMLNHLKERLLGIANPHLVVSCGQEEFEELKKNSFYALNRLPLRPFKPFKPEFSMKTPESQARLISSPVAFTAKVIKTVSYQHPDSPALCLAAQICDNVVLHSKIREQGGAYGGGATCNSLSGNFYFYAYRDPNIFSSLEAFEEAVEMLVKGEFDEEDVEEAKLEMIQKSDAPVAPGARGAEAYSLLREKKTTAIRQKQREKMLNVTKEDIIEAVKRHVLPQMKTAATVVFASQYLVNKENSTMLQKGLPTLPSYKV